MSERIFFDTYALFELSGGNKEYKPFGDSLGILTIFNLAEFNYALKRQGYPDADERTRRFESWVVDVNVKIITEAMSFRIKHRDLSVPDAIGYITAKHHDCPFLTGDKAFEHLENVAFVR